MNVLRYDRRLKRSFEAGRALLVSALFAAFSLAVPAAANAAPVSSASAKPQGVSPSSIHNTLSGPVAGKGGAQTNVVRPDIAWAVSLTASANYIWPAQSSVLTATANMNVGPTPYYLEIFDATAHAYVAICGTGTSCTATVTQPLPTTHSYTAYVANYPASMTAAPSGVQASASTYVLWHGVTVNLSNNLSTVGLNGVVTLTSTTGSDIGPSPQWNEIYDATTGTRLAYCGSGTVCTTTVSQSVATTHKYVAYVSSFSTANPPAGIIATSNAVFVTWTSGVYRVSLVGPTSTYSGTATLTAVSNINVGPTPYYIEIFNVDTGTLVGTCGTGTTCALSATLHYGANHFVAFVSNYSSALPPVGTQATSNESITNMLIIP